MIKKSNHHGVNPAIAHLDIRTQKTILKDEARRRELGEWGSWQTVDKDQYQRTFKNLKVEGWILDTRAVHRNKVFCVLERLDVTGVVHVGVTSLSGIRPTWYEMQRIKNELFGPETTAVEIYPPQKHVVDGSDMFHLWILPGELPFGLHKLDASRKATTPAGELLGLTL